MNEKDNRNEKMSVIGKFYKSSLFLSICWNEILFTNALES